MEVYGNSEQHRATRRRGEALEADILQAAWEELSAVGYAQLTMEGVAARAKTSKTVVYRRWPNRAALVLAAMAQHSPVLSGDVPNTGSLRSDVITLLGRMLQRLQAIGMDTIHGLMSESVNNQPIFVYIQNRKAAYEAMKKILERAAERGEVNLEHISPRVATVPIALARHEVLTSLEPLSEAVIVEIVDDIFLPLVRASPR